MHQRHRQTTDRQTTDGRLIAYSERNVVRSLKIEEKPANLASPEKTAVKSKKRWSGSCNYDIAIV